MKINFLFIEFQITIKSKGSFASYRIKHLSNLDQIKYLVSDDTNFAGKKKNLVLTDKNLYAMMDCARRQCEAPRFSGPIQSEAL